MDLGLGDLRLGESGKSGGEIGLAVAGGIGRGSGRYQALKTLSKNPLEIRKGIPS